MFAYVIKRMSSGYLKYVSEIFENWNNDLMSLILPDWSGIKNMCVFFMSKGSGLGPMNTTAHSFLTNHWLTPLVGITFRGQGKKYLKINK